MPTWDIDFRSDVYLGAPNEEDGSRRDHLSFYVTATNARGAVYGHRFSFTTEEYDRKEAEQLVAKLAARVQAAQDAGTWTGPTENSHWTRTYSVYGSEDYCTNEAEYVELEKRADEGGY